MRHSGRRNVLFRTTRNARINPVPPFHVLIVIRPIREMVLALVARIRPFASVLTPMRRQHALETETFPAKFARERHRARMNAMVLFQSAPFAELPAAHVALVWLKAGMNGRVLLEAHQRLERLPAHVALEGARGGVR